MVEPAKINNLKFRFFFFCKYKYYHFKGGETGPVGQGAGPEWGEGANEEAEVEACGGHLRPVWDLIYRFFGSSRAA
jgi:hypothetical protein